MDLREFCGKWTGIERPCSASQTREPEPADRDPRKPDHDTYHPGCDEPTQNDVGPPAVLERYRANVGPLVLDRERGFRSWAMARPNGRRSRYRRIRRVQSKARAFVFYAGWIFLQRGTTNLGFGADRFINIRDVVG